MIIKNPQTNRYFYCIHVAPTFYVYNSSFTRGTSYNVVDNIITLKEENIDCSHVYTPFVPEGVIQGIEVDESNHIKCYKQKIGFPITFLLINIYLVGGKIHYKEVVLNDRADNIIFRQYNDKQENDFIVEMYEDFKSKLNKSLRLDDINCFISSENKKNFAFSLYDSLKHIYLYQNNMLYRHLVDNGFGMLYNSRFKGIPSSCLLDDIKEFYEILHDKNIDTLNDKEKEILNSNFSRANFVLQLFFKYNLDEHLYNEFLKCFQTLNCDTFMMYIKLINYISPIDISNASYILSTINKLLHYVGANKNYNQKVSPKMLLDLLDKYREEISIEKITEICRETPDYLTLNTHFDDIITEKINKKINIFNNAVSCKDYRKECIIDDACEINGFVLYFKNIYKISDFYKEEVNKILNNFCDNFSNNDILLEMLNESKERIGFVKLNVKNGKYDYFLINRIEPNYWENIDKYIKLLKEKYFKTFHLIFLNREI